MILYINFNESVQFSIDVYAMLFFFIVFEQYVVCKNAPSRTRKRNEKKQNITHHFLTIIMKRKT